MKTREEEAGQWLVDNNWDYSKYGDKRPNRDAYSTLMRYEITGELDLAHEAGQRVGEQRVLVLLRSEATKGVGHHYDSLAFAAIFLETKLKELK